MKPFLKTIKIIAIAELVFLSLQMLVFFINYKNTNFTLKTIEVGDSGVYLDYPDFIHKKKNDDYIKLYMLSLNQRIPNDGIVTEIIEFTQYENKDTFETIINKMIPKINLIVKDNIGGKIKGNNLELVSSQEDIQNNKTVYSFVLEIRDVDDYPLQVFGELLKINDRYIFVLSHTTYFEPTQAVLETAKQRSKYYTASIRTTYRKSGKYNPEEGK